MKKPPSRPRRGRADLGAGRIRDDDRGARDLARGTGRIADRLDRAGRSGDGHAGDAGHADLVAGLRPGVPGHRIATLGLEGDGPIGLDDVRPDVLVDTAGLAVAPSDADLDDEGTDAGRRRDRVPARLADDVGQDGRDPREPGLERR